MPQAVLECETPLLIKKVHTGMSHHRCGSGVPSPKFSPIENTVTLWRWPGDAKWLVMISDLSQYSHSNFLLNPIEGLLFTFIWRGGMGLEAAVGGGWQFIVLMKFETVKTPPPLILYYPMKANGKFCLLERVRLAFEKWLGRIQFIDSLAEKQIASERRWSWIL